MVSVPWMCRVTVNPHALERSDGVTLKLIGITSVLGAVAVAADAVAPTTMRATMNIGTSRCRICLPFLAGRQASEEPIFIRGGGGVKRVRGNLFQEEGVSLRTCVRDLARHRVRTICTSARAWECAASPNGRWRACVSLQD